METLGTVVGTYLAIGIIWGRIQGENVSMSLTWPLWVYLDARNRWKWEND